MAVVLYPLARRWEASEPGINVQYVSDASIGPKALFGIPDKTRLGFRFTAKIETQPKNSVWTLNLTKFLFDKHLVTRLG